MRGRTSTRSQRMRSVTTRFAPRRPAEEVVLTPDPDPEPEPEPGGSGQLDFSDEDNSALGPTIGVF